MPLRRFRSRIAVLALSAAALTAATGLAPAQAQGLRFEPVFAPTPSPDPAMNPFFPPGSYTYAVPGRASEYPPDYGLHFAARRSGCKTVQRVTTRLGRRVVYKRDACADAVAIRAVRALNF